MKLVARVTTMSGTRERLMTQPTEPLRRAAPRMMPTAMRNVTASGCPSISRAATELVSTSMAPIPRSMPPEITITAWPTAR
jgi:hypothetical protein